MDLSDRVSESVIKILQNVKGSVSHDVAKWTHDPPDAPTGQQQNMTSFDFQSAHHTSTNDEES